VDPAANCQVQRERLAQLNVSTWLCLFLALVSIRPCFAHDAGASYLRLTVSNERIEGRWEIDVHDLHGPLKPDANADGNIAIDELLGRQRALHDYATRHLKVSVDSTVRAIRIIDAEPIIERRLNGTNVILNFLITNVSAPKILQIDYRLLFDIKPQHRGLLQLDSWGQTQTAIFSPDHCTERFDIGMPNPKREFLSFCWQGVWHIWIGFDHILFLVALLLPSVLKREQLTWRAVNRFGEAFFNVFKIVTAFTVAHSITLSLAALEIVRLPSRWVESVIAASVIIAALNNIRPVVRGRPWLIAFGFGLIHGFGFASVLTELGLPHGSLWLALAGFNIGVEAGQLVIVAGFLPLAYALRSTRFYESGLLRYGSLVIALVAGIWFVERTFNLTSK